MRVNFKHPVSSKDRKKKRIAQVKADAEEAESGFDVNMGEEGDVVTKMEQMGLTKAKRTQLFKKSKAKSLQAQISQLRADSKKLNKKNLKQKEQKGKIAKEIKLLKAQIRRSGEAMSDSDSD